MNSIEPNLDDDNQLEKIISQIEEENFQIRRENLFFRRYLQRVENSSIVKSFNDFDSSKNENEIAKNRWIQSTSMIRRKSSLKTSKTNSLAELFQSAQVSSLIRLEREKISMAAYELEQMKLDWQRMKENGIGALENCQIRLDTVTSDIRSEQQLNEEMKKTIGQIQSRVLLAKRTQSQGKDPTESIVSLLRKQIIDRTMTLGLFNTENTNLHNGIHRVDALTENLQRFRERMDEIDINYARTKRVDALDRYKIFQQDFQRTKACQYPLFRQLEKFKILLDQNEKEKNQFERKIRFNETERKRLDTAIKSIENQIDLIEKETRMLIERFQSVHRVPSIIDYCQLVHQDKKLNAEILRWDRRIRVAQLDQNQP